MDPGSAPGGGTDLRIATAGPTINPLTSQVGSEHREEEGGQFPFLEGLKTTKGLDSGGSLNPNYILRSFQLLGGDKIGR